MTRLASYITGFILSVVLTALPLGLVWVHEANHHAFPTHEVMYAAFTLFAVLQLLVQLFFFFHMDEEARPRWNLVALCFALLVVGILMGGTLWIMSNLSHMQEGMQTPFIHGDITPESSND